MLSFFNHKKVSITTLFSNEFVDIHSHLLPSIDDGSKSMDETIALLIKMHSFGIQNFITTPHIMEGVWENAKDTILPKLTAVKKELIARNLTDISIHAAAEYMLDSNFNILLEQRQLLPLKENKILVEMSYINPPVNLYEILFNIQIAGYQPVLAHPERYLFFHKKYKEYSKLKEAGCLFQLNLLSLSNYYGKDTHKIALQLLKDNLIDFVGTDTHNKRHLSYLESIDNPKILKLIAPIIKNNAEFK
ncbi:CpsB/CapC family capsule biosynthesis tyrosine phosphatase [Lutibacter sp.]|uniref:tyrosine-protein phosphatase n=1 Tax=Lutibacter sp. TaxID=1925666 RepID=UPI0025B9C0C0|nr:CpsB/CapC family capsule biosynthesis tyrosine phosphatase [Lutibacter sp.]MCF6168243.1 histidinol phosphatase [Lutibacter sp.]